MKLNETNCAGNKISIVEGLNSHSPPAPDNLITTMSWRRCATIEKIILP